MPIYEYQCSDCSHKLEVMQRMRDDPLQVCPECNEPKLRKLVSASSFVLKGNGWYATDFAGKDKPAEAEKPKSSDAKKTDSTVAKQPDTSSKKSDALSGSNPN